MGEPLIAVIDDDPATLEMMQAVLELKGYQTLLWSDTTGAQTMIRERQPALVILDLWMGDPEAGWKILTQMRQDEATTHIPAIMFSADWDSLHVRQRVLEAKRCAVLRKPFRINELLDKVDEALTRPEN